MDGKCSPHHTQSGQSSNQQPEHVEQEVEVDVVGDEKDDAVTEQTVTLATDGDVRLIKFLQIETVCGGSTDQQRQHLQHGDLGVDQVRQEVDEGGNAEPVTKTRSYSGPHQSSLSLKDTKRQSFTLSSPGQV